MFSFELDGIIAASNWTTRIILAVTFPFSLRLEIVRSIEIKMISIYMKKLLVAVMGMLCATALVVSAQDAPAKPKKAKLTAEQQALQKDMLAKYDANKDGKIDKTERAAITKEDKEKMIKAGLLKAPKKAAAATGSSTNAPAN